LFAAGLFLILTVPRMTQPGMFSDGVVYASIARNMAEGRGTFWAPEYTKTVLTVFHDHPPLGLALEASFFRVAGDHPWVERAYSLTAGLVLALLIVMLWRRMGPDKRGDWLPLVFWLLPSFVSWSIVNNMLDVTQAVFTTFAVLAAVTAMTSHRHLIWSALAGVAVSAAVLTKGPVGLFPLAAPAIYALIVDRNRAMRAAAVTAVMAGVPTLMAAALWQYPPARAAARADVDVQLLPSLSGQREVAESRWHFVEVFVLEIVARMGGLLAIAWMIARRLRSAGTAVDAAQAREVPAHVRGDVPYFGRSMALFFLCVGLSASLPIAISPKMMGHYFVPSIPMFAIAGALFAYPLRTWRVPLWSAYVAGAVGLVLAVSAIALPIARGPFEERDVPRLGALDLIGPSLRPGEIVRTCPEAEGDWPLHAYLQRYLHVSMDAAAATPRPTFLRLLDRPCEVPAGCVLVRFAGDLEMYVCPAP
jgi:4-amino-4-deoxy-L-arabinose transferase-like glycosyltransferase